VIVFLFYIFLRNKNNSYIIIDSKPKVETGTTKKWWVSTKRKHFAAKNQQVYFRLHPNDTRE